MAPFRHVPGQNRDDIHHVLCCIVPRRKDLLGTLEVPADAYYGIQTLRAANNFHLSGVPLSHYPKLVVALAMVKQAAADANRELGHLSDAKHAAISAACARLIKGDFHDQFVVDMIQGGAGTSTNMNANEVIANVALEAMGHQKVSTSTCTLTTT